MRREGFAGGLSETVAREIEHVSRCSTIDSRIRTDKKTSFVRGDVGLAGGAAGPDRTELGLLPGIASSRRFARPPGGFPLHGRTRRCL